MPEITDRLSRPPPHQTWHVFDNISNNANDTSPLSPLTPLIPLASPISVDDAEHLEHNSEQALGWRWSDADDKDYRSREENENDLKGPPRQEQDLEEISAGRFYALKGTAKDAHMRIFQELCVRLDWTNPETISLLINKATFRTELCNVIRRLVQVRNGCLKNCRPVKPDRTYEYLEQMKNDLEASDKTHNMRVMLHMFSEYCSRANIPGKMNDLQDCMGRVILILRKIRGQKRLGINLRKQARWLGLLRTSDTNIKKMEGKLVFESELQREEAIKKHGFAISETVVIGEDFSRICCPENLDRPYPIILWTKNSPEDNEPDERKVFGAIIYNATRDIDAPVDELEELEEKAANAISEGLQDLNLNTESAHEPSQLLDSKFIQRLRFRVFTDSVLRGVSLNRSKRLRDGGAMMTTVGTGQSSTHFIPSRGVKSARSNKETETVDALRKDVKSCLPVWQALEHAFLEGFMPTMAKDFQEAASASEGLHNPLGFPNISSFATYGYLAGAHLDNDDTPSIGRVLRRDPKFVKRDESNFVYFSHRLIVELAVGVLWLWRAKEDHHGTTVNAMALSHRHIKNWANLARDNVNAAQWTVASVLPHAVAAAAAKTQANRNQ